MPSGVYLRKKLQFCKNGHDTFAIGRNKDGHCQQCDKDWKHEWYLQNLKKCKLQGRESGWKAQGIINSDGSTFTMLDYDRLYQIQQGKCAICKRHQTEFKSRFCVDHNHKTGKIRGLLCRRDNHMLGTVEKLKETDLLNISIEYLKQD
jgi:hypothetical protein